MGQRSNLHSLPVAFLWSLPVDVQSSLCLIKYHATYITINHHAMKTYWGVEVQLHTFLILALVGGGQLHAPAVYPRGESSRYPFYRRPGWLQRRSEHGDRGFYILSFSEALLKSTSSSSSSS